MRLCLLCLVLPLIACSGPNEIKLAPIPHNVPPDLLTSCPGYTGPVPQNEGQLSDALVAEAGGRACANGKLEAVDEVLNGVRAHYKENVQLPLIGGA